MTFCLTDYDAYGFDLDHTLAKYKLTELCRLSYEGTCDALIKLKGYDNKLKDDITLHKDFICKGLFLDADKGNILKLSHDGKILRASHGTQMLTPEELKKTYGEDLHWEHFKEAKDNVKSTDAKFRYRFFENFFDIPVAVVCAHVVDHLDEQNGGPQKKYTFWHDVYASIQHNYTPSGYKDDVGYFFPPFRKDPEKYLQPCSDGVKQWLLELKKQGKLVFLMTTSSHDFATTVLKVVLGSDWQKYFDISIFNATKPAFFTAGNSFLGLDGYTETNPVTELQPKTCYSKGNHRDLMQFISQQTKQVKPKVLYFGDSLCSDSFPANNYAGWDVVLVLEEMEAEGYHLTPKDLECDDADEKKPKRPVNLYIDPEEESYLLSKVWGSFFYHEEEDVKHDKHMNTFWGRLISQYNVIAVPLIEYIAGMPIDHKYTRFGSEVGNTEGFSPAKPKPLL